MDFRNDDLHIVTYLSRCLSEALQNSKNRTSKIEESLKKISKYTDSNTDQLFRQEPDKDHYISKKWEQVLQQNENVLETVKEWINENPELLTKNVLDLEDQLNDLKLQYRNSRIGVLNDVKISEHKIELVYGALQSILKEMESSESTKQQYINKRDELVKAIAKLDRQLNI
ncbi:hypothetical protein BN7_3494 [Wickerhamomyces ciferrii]|uniref:Uncharacterized protein n=1 Tax=Wickerhamomyces ciferrii (strain ATCC 14091 / BCRC 22168 / CBS 111 / JCM 3599 / NBRC 0793 / NRRL Y-1031 F-60-10) TaxID=1206466 RepID=K0KRL0_WICCF|nr:uncharacterized protein BN7_3494 [Wickerhamomyces ciferrii]CCH43939.1 hypothetical protein BN7_3494 [Wickerhamomyces ciferrii]